ncbi:M20 family metallopeptidase [Muricauda sp. ANG21]|uniref:M20 family metallopeptidase n=1 Tax=Allomuricauda sp. ANG21 TaxID=3042468 RepID=UPI003456D9D3
MNPIDLTQQLIGFDTINPPGNEEGAARYIGNILAGHGFSVEYPQFDKGRLNVIATKGLSKEALPIVLTGHLDVVPLGAKKWRFDPLIPTIENGKLYGRGSSDMKSGVAAMIVAAIQCGSRNCPKGGIKLIFTANEELGCIGAQYLRQIGYKIGKASAIVVGEPTSNVPYSGHKGGLYLKAVTSGTTAHSSTPELGDNAIYKAARAITKIETLKFNGHRDSLLGYPTINVGKIVGGLNLNSVPDETEFTIDIRSTTKFNNDRAIKVLQKKLGPEVSLIKTVDLEAIATPENSNFLKMALDVCSYDYGVEGVVKAAPFLTDASVLTPWMGNPPTLILGPGEAKMAHQTDEYCHVENITTAVELYSEIIKRNSYLQL